MQGGVVPAVGGDQVLRRAVLEHPTVLEHEHPVGDLHRAEPVGDDHRGPVGEDRAQRLLHQPLARARPGSRSPRPGSAPPGRRGRPGRTPPAAAGRPRADRRAWRRRCRSPRAAAAMNSCAPTARAAASISARVASGRPKAMLSATVPVEHEVLLGDHHDVRGAGRRRRARAGRRRRAGPARRSGRRSAPSAWRWSSCPPRWCPPGPRSGRPGRPGPGRAAPGGRPRSRSPDPVEDAPRRAACGSATGCGRLGHRRAASSSTPDSFSSAEDADWKVL